MHETLLFNSFESVDFKYSNSFSKLQPKNTKIGNFWFQIQSFFVHKILYLDKFVGAGVKYDKRFFKFQLKSIKIKDFGVNVKAFSFLMKLCNLKNSRVLISNMTIAFFKIAI